MIGGLGLPSSDDTGEGSLGPGLLGVSLQVQNPVPPCSGHSHTPPPLLPSGLCVYWTDRRFEGMEFFLQAVEELCCVHQVRS